MQALLGANYDPALFNEASMRQQALNQLIDRSVLTQTAAQQGMRVSDQQLNQAIQAITTFQENGVFNAERYQRMLQVQGYTPNAFEERMRQDLMTEQLRAGLVETPLITEAELEQLVALTEQKRDLHYFVLPLAEAKDAITVDDEQIASYYEQNENRFMSPEQVKVQYLELTLEAMAEDIELSEEDLQIAYQEQLARYTEQEERSASHILFALPADADEAATAAAKQRAQALYESISSGERTFADALTDFAAGGQEDVEAGELGIILKGMMEPSFEQALFALADVEAITEPVQTSSGFHLIRLDKIKAEQVKPFAEVHEDLERSLKLRRAESYFFDSAENLANLSFEHPDSLDPAAQALGLEIAESNWLQRGFKRPGLSQYPKVLDAAFSADVLERGMNSEPIEVKPSHLIVLRSLEHREPKTLEIEAARSSIIEQIKRREARKVLQQQADDLLDKAKAGETFAVLAEAAGVELQTAEQVSRNQTDVDASIVQQAFSLAPPQQDNQAVYGTTTLSNGNRAVFAVIKVQPGRLEDIEEAERDTLKDRIVQAIGAAQFNAFLENRREQAEISIFENDHDASNM